MNRNTAIALGLEALVIGGLAASASRAGAGPAPNTRPIPPSTARRAFAAHDGTIVRDRPGPGAGVVATLGMGSGIRVGGQETSPGSGFLSIVREWVEDGVRFSRDLGFIRASDVVYSDPRAPTGSPFTSPFYTPTGRDEEVPRGDRSDGGECDLFATLTWPSSVDHFKERLDTVWSATNRSVQECPGFPAADRDEWNLTYGRWRAFAETKTPTFGSGAYWDQTCAWGRTLDGWRRRLAQTQCPLVGPVNIQGYALPGGVEAGLGSIATIVKWGALTVGGAILVATLYPEIQAGLSALRAGRTLRGRSARG